VEAVGTSVTTVVPGDRVLASFISACGSCQFCCEAHYGQCLGGGAGSSATRSTACRRSTRTPFADISLYKVPEDLSNE
jgi:alcohol dehydrogenase